MSRSTPGWAIVLVMLVGGGLSACDADGDVKSGGATETREIEVRGARTAFTVQVPADWGITDIWDADTCGSVSYRLSDETLRLHVEAVPTLCPEAGRDTQIGNGFHGVYRTIDDVPAPLEVETVATDLGQATVFNQNYFECTNSCSDWDEPLAIITLTDPVDAAYPTLVVRGQTNKVTRSDLEQIVASMEPPYVATG